MRIERSRSRFTFRPRHRRSGCLSLTVLAGLLVGVAALIANGFWRSTPAPGAAEGRAAADDAAQAFARGDLNAAVDRAQQALALLPGDPDVVTLLARALLYRSYVDYDRDVDRLSALNVTAMALEASPDALPLMAIHALLLQANGEHVAAARLANRVLERDAAHPLARLALALAYTGVGSFEAALREAQSVTASNPDAYAMDALRVLALTQSGVGRYRDAAATADRAIALHNALIPLYFERALYALQLGDSDAATVAYFQIIALDTRNVKARMRLCELSSTLRERDAALRYCREVTDLAPQWADGWYMLGRESFLQGDFRAAQQQLNRCATLQTLQSVPVPQRRFECWYLQGQAAELLGDCPALIATYNEFVAMRIAGNLPQTWVYPPEGPPGCVPTITPG